MFGRTRWRMVGWSILVLALILVALGAILYASLSRSLIDAVDGSLLASSEAAQVELNETGEAGELEREGYRAGLFYLVIAPDGSVLANPQQVDPRGLPADLVGPASPRFASVDIAGDPVRIYARDITEPGGGPATLLVGQSLVPEREAGQRLLLILLLGGVTGLLLSFAGAWFLAARALVPIQEAFDRQQEFVADASHELRTPLTIMHSAADLLDQLADEPLRANRNLLDEVRQEIARMERLTRDLLTLARSDRGELHLSLGRLDLAVFVHELGRRIATLAQARSVALDLDVQEPHVVVEADPDRLQQVGLIVLDNALNHTPAGGRIRIQVRKHAHEGVLVVEDTGEGIPPEHLARIFERFHRVDPSRSRNTGGAGLGLAIAHGLVTAHGGRIAVANRFGGGTRVTIWLPLSEPASQPADDPELSSVSGT